MGWENEVPPFPTGWPRCFKAQGSFLGDDVMVGGPPIPRPGSVTVGCHAIGRATDSAFQATSSRRHRS